VKLTECIPMTIHPLQSCGLSCKAPLGRCSLECHTGSSSSRHQTRS